MRAAALLLVLVAAPAPAQVTFRDDFESGPLLLPGGQWDLLTQDDPADTIGFTTAASHTGDGGLHVSSGMSAGGSNIGVTRFSGGAGAAQYVRLWFRPASLTAAAGFDNVVIISRNSSFYTACQLYWHAPTRTFRLAAFDRGNVTTLRDLDAGLVPVGQWKLVELAALGMGTSTGRCRAWLDGALLDQIAGLDWSGLTLRDVALGPVNASNGNDVAYDYDAFAASAVIPPSRVDLNAPAQATAGACTPIDVVLLSSDRAATPTPQLVSVSLLFPAWSDAACTMPVATADIVAGTSTRRVWARPAATGFLGLTHPDLLPGGSEIFVVQPDAGTPDAGPPDAGTPDAGASDAGTADSGVADAGAPDAGAPDAGAPLDPRSYGLGCGCASMPELPLLLIAAALSVARRRRTPSSARRR